MLNTALFRVDLAGCPMVFLYILVSVEDIANIAGNSQIRRLATSVVDPNQKLKIETWKLEYVYCFMEKFVGGRQLSSGMKFLFKYSNYRFFSLSLLIVWKFYHVEFWTFLYIDQSPKPPLFNLRMLDLHPEIECSLTILTWDMVGPYYWKIQYLNGNDSKLHVNFIKS